MGERGNARQVEDADEVDLIGLEGDGEGEHVELPHRGAALERDELPPAATVVLELLVVREEDALADDVRQVVPELVDALEADVRHPDVVSVRIGERDPEASPRGA